MRYLIKLQPKYVNKKFFIAGFDPVTEIVSMIMK